MCGKSRLDPAAALDRKVLGLRPVQKGNAAMPLRQQMVSHQAAHLEVVDINIGMRLFWMADMHDEGRA